MKFTKVRIACFIGALAVIAALSFVPYFQNANANQTAYKSDCPKGWVEPYINKCVAPEEMPLYNRTSTVVLNDVVLEAQVSSVVSSLTYNSTTIFFSPPIQVSFYTNSPMSKSISNITLDGIQYYNARVILIGQPIEIHYQLTYQVITYYARNGTLIQEFCNNDNGFCHYPTFHLVSWFLPALIPSNLTRIQV